MIGDHFADGWEGGEPQVGECQRCDVFVQDVPTYSQVLGPDGEPLEYEAEPFGFDLRRKT